MIPYHFPQFDVFSLEELLLFLQDDYFSHPIQKIGYKNTYYFYLYHNSVSSNIPVDQIKENLNIWSFYIVVDLPAFSIKVFIRNFEHFSFSQDVTSSPYVEIHRSTNTNKGNHEKETPHGIFMAFCCNRKHKCPEGILKYFQYQNAHYLPSRKYPTNKARNDAIEDILKKCPGDVVAEFITEDKNDNEKSQLHKISIVFPWAKYYFYGSHYLELDASFTAVKPYAFCVAQGIIFNESIPLSITITPSESIELYKTTLDRFVEVFERELRESYIKINWSQKIVLSDMGKSICAICQQYEITHFFCHRHILEHFGSASALGLIVQQILYCFSQDKCKDLILKLQSQVDEYIRVITQIYGKVSPALQRKLDEVKTMMMLEEGNQNSNYYFKKWALWIRSQYSVPRCSNHNEALHRALNQQTDPSEIIVTKLDKLITDVIKHYMSLPKRMGSSIDRKINDTIKFLLSKLEDSNFDVFAYIKLNQSHPCNCHEEEYNYRIYGCQIPCHHSLLASAEPFLLKFNDCLKELNHQDQFNNYLSLILSHIKSTPQSILNLLKLNQAKMAPKLTSLIADILKKIRPNKPQIRFIPVDWGSLRYERINIPADQSSHDKQAETHAVSKGSPFQDVDLSSIYQHPGISMNENLAFQALLETAHQIHKVHSSMDFDIRIMPLCFGVFMARLKSQGGIPQEQEAFNHWCAEFKMACVLQADQWNCFDHPGSKKNHYKLLRNE